MTTVCDDPQTVHPPAQEYEMSQIQTVSARSGRIACSGRARSVLDHIDEMQWRVARPQRALTVPVSPYAYVQMNVPGTMTDREWAQMMRVLEAMKPGLVDRP
jgi:hypothetical protein